jgi:tetratricopeptide (TPR) repeat protein
MTTLRKYLDVVKAEMDKSLLDAAGIPAFIAGENSASIGYGGSIAEIHLQVQDADADRARQVLQESKEAAPLSDDFIPPEVPSSEEAELQRGDASTMRVVFSVVITLVFVVAMIATSKWWTLNRATFYYNRGVNLQVKGHLDGAIAAYSRAIDFNPRFVRAYDNRGLAKQAKGNLDGAIADYSSAIELDSKDAYAYDNRGVAKRAKDDLDGAITDFDRTIKLDTGNAHAYNNRALIRQAKGDLDGAITDYDSAIELDPKDARFYNNRGLAKRAKGDLDGAIVDYNRAIELNSRYAHAYASRGSAKRANGDLDGALKDLSRAIELDPKNAHAYVYRASAERARSDLAGALADYNRAIEVDPKSVNAHYGRGVAHYDNRNWSEALSDFRKTSTLKPTDSKSETLLDYASIRIWMTRTKLGERDAATNELKQYLHTRTIGKPGDWPSTVASALIGNLPENDFLKAADSADEKQTRNQKCEAYFYAGTLRLLDGDKSTAADYFTKCLETGMKDFYEYQSAAAELEALKH